LTDVDDLVVDFFAGSNTTGMVAEDLRRRWLAFDADLGYLAASAFRFLPPSTAHETSRTIHEQLSNEVEIDLARFGVGEELELRLGG
jgi:site-specific DNA-methyltransferase (cytosine-N4-specific)